MSKSPIDASIAIEVIYLDGGVTYLPDDHTTGWRHLPFHVCGQVSDGEGYLVYDDGTAVIIPTGAGFFVPAGVRHNISKVGQDLMVSRWAHFLVGVGKVYDPLATLAIPSVFPYSVGEQIGRLCTRMAEQEDATLPLFARQALKQALQLELVAILAGKGIESPHPVDPPGLQRIKPLLAVLHAQPETEYDIAAMAEMVSLSPSRFHAIFKTCLGKSPLQYQQELRLKLAQRLLVATDQTVQEIGAHVGYSDPFHFSRLFKANTGKSPREFRISMRQSMWVSQEQNGLDL